ncbi:hypothetical protein BDF20DRAFT_482146 [Mycotypha africana]|uniref:uncharacterized protein n=1 Tax=Mycotypha africana TaxID=64632 RepID=UPI0023006472|nr:uncharacterized protein BDF20DRAFT_482146 [Mycotypha africana]KAI8979142.1 hypothetical protein BDF20DRAFT_482146 [Mycotypha africana]
MRLILAESGSEIETSNKFLRSHDVKDLMELQKEVHNRANIKPADQILLSLNGIQIKPTAQDTNTLWQQINVVEEQLWGKKLVADRQDTLVVFNRRYITMQQFESTPIDDSFLLLVDEGSNSKYFDANLSKHYNGEIPSWNLMNAWFDGKLTKNSFEINPEKILTNLNNRKMKTLSNISKLTSETRNHYIALSAALHNLESHVRTAEETVNKFNRIAQREFSKQAAALTAMDLDTRLIQQIKIHPYILESIVTVDGVKSSALTTEAKESSTSATATPSQESFLIDYAAPLEQLREAKQALQKRFDELTLATTEQTNKIQFIHKQANQIRNCENFVCFTSTEEAEEFEGYSQLWGSSEKKINERLIKEPAFIATNENRKTVNRELILSLKVAYTCEMGSRDHEASTKMKKQKAWNAFVQGMQKISQIEQSISHVYPKLAELEQKVKALRLELEKGQGALIRRIITGYGVLLIELWRREQYSQIVSENADLLSDLFQQFGEREQRYRHAFNNKEIVCLEDATQLFFSERANDKKPALLPFKVKGLNDLPILSQTTLTQQKDVGQMTSTVLKKGTAISRKDIEALIKFISTFYAESINQHEESEFLKDIISPILQQKFERETTRLNRALMHLGLPDPGQHQQKKKLNGLHASTAEPSPNTIKVRVNDQ